MKLIDVNIYFFKCSCKTFISFLLKSKFYYVFSYVDKNDRDRDYYDSRSNRRYGGRSDQRSGHRSERRSDSRSERSSEHRSERRTDRRSERRSERSSRGWDETPTPDRFSRDYTPDIRPKGNGKCVMSIEEFLFLAFQTCKWD